MKQRLRQALIVILFSTAAAVIFNVIYTNGIPFIGNWPSAIGSAEAAVPPSAEEGDPPFITLDEAAAFYQTTGVIFVDARDPEDYDYGHIQGAINIPYDYLPEENPDGFWEKTMVDIPTDRTIVIYCSGTECELSLYLGREMAQLGYMDVNIFYGGWSEWENADLPIVKGN